jgi:UDP-4-amino-4,6-dideoxy-N-acetyl-beta-L-altrosamine transaminase
MKNIPYGHQWIDEDDAREVVKVLKSGWLTQGPQIQEFEKALCECTGAKYAVVVSSGTAALHIACLAAGISKNDEVITSPITFVASANCVLYCGGRPVFADIQEDTANIDPRAIEKKITARTKAIIPVHFAGHPCDMKEIRNIAKRHSLLVIEDAAHALGAEYKGSKIGSCAYSDMTIFSFHPVKAITTGEGGAILTNNKRLYQKLLLFRNHGITKDVRSFAKNKGAWYYEMRELGFNYRITDIQAALGISQLKKLDKFVDRRRAIAREYDRAFSGNPFFEVQKERQYARSAFHLYPIRLHKRFISDKKSVFHSLRDKDLGVQVHYIPVYLQPYYKKLGFRKGTCPNSEIYYNREISLPIYPALKADQIRRVIDTVFKVFDRL